MFCTECGKPLQDNANFCASCGAAITSVSVEETKVESANATVTTAVPQTEPDYTASAQYNTAESSPAPNVATPTYTQPQYSAPVQVAQKKPFNKALLLLLLIPIVAIVLVGAIIIGSVAIGFIGKSSLKKDIQGEWSRVELGDSTSYTLVLDVDEYEIDYKFKSLFINQTIGVFEYEVISSNKIEVTRNGVSRTITVKFNSDKSMMTFTPALTNSAASENWFDHS